MPWQYRTSPYFASPRPDDTRLYATIRHYAYDWHNWTVPSRYIAVHNLAKTRQYHTQPCHYVTIMHFAGTMPHITLPTQHDAWLYSTFPRQNLTVLYCTLTAHHHALPIHYETTQDYAFTMHSITSPQLNNTMLYHHYTPHHFTDTSPSRNETIHCLAFPLRDLAILCQRFTKLCVAALHPCVTILNFTSTLRYFASLHVTFTLAGQHNATPQLYWTKLYLYITSRHYTFTLHTGYDTT